MVNLGHEAGSTAMQRTFFPSCKFKRKNGKAIPAKFDPPPNGAITMSGKSPAISICFTASSPITVWCINTWFKTLPSAYFVSALVAARSTASEIAMPKLPGEFGS